MTSGSSPWRLCDAYAEVSPKTRSASGRQRPPTAGRETAQLSTEGRWSGGWATRRLRWPGSGADAIDHSSRGCQQLLHSLIGDTHDVGDVTCAQALSG